MTEKEKTTEKTPQQQFREQYKVAENAFRIWNSWIDATIQTNFELVDKALRYNQELRSQADRMAVETLTAYRQIYQDGFKTWQSYVQSVNDSVKRGV